MIGAVVLAAGRARRMGAPKLLLPLGGRPLVARVVDELLAASLEPVVVVTGPDASPVASTLEGRAVRLARNEREGSEMLDLARVGLAHLGEGCEAALFTPGDLAGLERDTVLQLRRAFERGGRGIAVVTRGGRRGHPLLVSLRYRAEILAEHDGTGLRGLLRAHPDDVEEVEVGPLALPEDVDTPADYARWRERIDKCDRGG